MYTLRLYNNNGSLKEVKEVKTIEEVKTIWKVEKVKPTVWQDGKRLEGF